MPVSEIIAVEEADGAPHVGGKWQKMEKPYAFTGAPKEDPGRPLGSPGACRVMGVEGWCAGESVGSWEQG